MMVQEQLGRPQTSSAAPFPDIPRLFDFGLLGNHAIQAPTTFSPEDFAPRFHVPREVAAIPVEDAEPSELDWLEENAEELGRYPGEWLLIHDQRLLLHSRDFADLRVAIRERQIESPFVYYVPTDEEANAITI
jgi:hypothetical protein